VTAATGRERALPSIRVALAVAVLLRLPSLRYPLVSDDEAIYDAMAQVLVKGGVMYRDTVDHKPPGLAYSYALARWVAEHLGGSFGSGVALVHVAGILVVVLTCLVLHAVAREILPARLAPLPPLLYAVASATMVPPDSLAVNGELLMNLPTVLAVYATLVASRPQEGLRPVVGASWIALAGACAAIAALYKYQGAFIGLGLVSLALAEREPDEALAARWRRVSVWGVALAVGFVVPFACVAFYFASYGALADARFWGVSFNLHYLKEGPDFAMAAKRLAMQLLGVVLPSALLFGAGGIALARLSRGRSMSSVRLSRGGVLLIVWTLESLYAVTLGRRFFGHYFLQLELPLSLLAAPVVADLWERRPRVTVALLALPATVFFVIAAVPEVTAKLVYAADPDYLAVGQAVAARTKPDDRIWVWGNVPQVYFTAERAPGVRFTFCNYLTGLSPGSRSEYDPTVDPRANAVPEAWGMVVRDLDANKPAVIVDTAAGGMKGYGKFPVASFPVLAAYLGEHYERDGEVLGALLYRRRVE
jgi:hypothetical protein